MVSRRQIPTLGVDRVQRLACRKTLLGLVHIKLKIGNYRQLDSFIYHPATSLGTLLIRVTELWELTSSNVRVLIRGRNHQLEKALHIASSIISSLSTSIPTKLLYGVYYTRPYV